MVLRGTIVATVTPKEFRGRVMAAEYVIGMGGGQLGSLEAGAVGSLTSPAISAFSGGLLTVLGAVVIGAALPAFRRYCEPSIWPMSKRERSSPNWNITSGTRCSRILSTPIG